jgi:PIF1-like helicase/Helix-turn-helix domain/Helicase
VGFAGAIKTIVHAIMPVPTSMEPTDSLQDVIETAARFINSTSSHIFLTGKAGTGKTTFLRGLASRTHKNFIVVAPTGIAALNAGGVTIHSQFLFPMGMFIPDKNIPINLKGTENFYTSDVLARNHPLDARRRMVLRSLDLLVIDEVSMLRADLLDAIDYRMKAARGNFAQSFGGVQILMIGDLYQLPPVVKREEENLVRSYYPSVWFFEARSLQQNGFVYIELDKIFRQRDDKFIGLLNNLRNNCPTTDDIQTLNTFYKSDSEIREIKEVITLTTHNALADELNLRSLNSLETKAHVFDARIEGDFPESMFPVLQRLTLKVGAQIMFTKNDNDGKMYFNGKIATVTKIGNGEIEVEMAETKVRYTLKRETWENKKYKIDTEKQELNAEVVGTFEQYPVKLAWAITVHKSQGLTFDKAIIDVGQAFADGQVYVALSRLRTIEGLILRTRINPNVISTDKKIVSFTQDNHQPEQLPQKMKERQLEFITQLTTRTFDFTDITKEIGYMKRNSASEFLDEEMKPLLMQIEGLLHAQKNNTEKFKWELSVLLNEGNHAKLVERIEAGAGYYKKLLLEQLKQLLIHTHETKKQKRVKTYLGHLADLDQMLFKKLEELVKASFLVKAIINQTNDYNFSHLIHGLAEERENILKEIKQAELDRQKVESRDQKSTKKKKERKQKDKGDKQPSYEISLAMLNTGMTVEAIAKERQLAEGTIESHLEKAVVEGQVSIFKIMSKERIEEISNAILEMPEGFDSKNLFDKLHGKYGYGPIKAVMNFVKKNKE